MHCGFHTKRGRWDTLGFSKGETEFLRVISLLGENFIFLFKSFRTT